MQAKLFGKYVFQHMNSVRERCGRRETVQNICNVSQGAELLTLADSRLFIPNCIFPFESSTGEAYRMRRRWKTTGAGFCVVGLQSAVLVFIFVSLRSDAGTGLLVTEESALFGAKWL